MRMITFLLVFLISFSFVSAIQTNLKEEYSASETAIVKISGSVLEPIKTSQINVKRINVNVPVEYGVNKIGEDYYVWFITPQNAGNYTFIIKDVVTSENSQVKKVEYTKGFSVGENKSNFYVKPGIIQATDKFNLDIYSNLDEDQKINLGGPFERELVLKSGLNEFEIYTSEIGEDYRGDLSVGSYSLPARITVETNNVSYNDSLNGAGEKILDVIPAKIQATSLFNQTEKYKFFIENTGDLKIDNVYLDYNRTLLKIEPDARMSIDINESVSFNISLVRKNFNSINEKILINYDGKISQIDFNLNLTNNAEEVDLNYYGGDSSKLLKCSEIPGEVCSSSQVCSGPVSASLDGSCCLSTCINTKAEEKNYKWIGYLIAGLVIVGGAYLYFRYKGAGESSEGSFLKMFNKED